MGVVNTGNLFRYKVRTKNWTGERICGSHKKNLEFKPPMERMSFVPNKAADQTPKWLVAKTTKITKCPNVLRIIFITLFSNPFFIPLTMFMAV